MQESTCRASIRGTSAGTRALATLGAWKPEILQFKIVMDDGDDTQVLGRLISLDLASATYLQAIVKYPRRNVQLRQGAQIIKRHDGEPKPSRREIPI